MDPAALIEDVINMLRQRQSTNASASITNTTNTTSTAPHTSNNNTTNPTHTATSNTPQMLSLNNTQTPLELPRQNPLFTPTVNLPNTTNISTGINNTLIAPRQNVGQATLRRLFAPYRKLSGPATKQSQITTVEWEHDFFCLANKDANAVPTVMEKFSLECCGLGKKRVKFTSRDDTHKDFVETIIGAFPQLSEAGGFRLFRCSRDYKFIAIPIPSEGYTIRYVRGESGLKRGVCYIVPIQKSLNTDVGNIPMLQNEVVVKEKCLQCSEEVPLHALGDHLTTCVGSLPDENCTTVPHEVSIPSTSSTLTNRITLSSERQTSFPVSLLLDSNMTTYNRCRALKRRRLQVPLSNSPDDFRRHIEDAFPELGNTPFELCRVDSCRKIIKLNLPVSSSIAVKMNGFLGRSSLYIRPKEDLETYVENTESRTFCRSTLRHRTTSRDQSHSPSPARSSTTRVQSHSPSPARSSTTRVQSHSPSPARSSTTRVQSHSPSPARSSTTRVQSHSPSPARSSTTRVQSHSPSPARSSTSRVQSRSPSPARSSFSHVLRHHPSHSRSSTSRVQSRSRSPARISTSRVQSRSPSPVRSSTTRIQSRSPSPARSSFSRVLRHHPSHSGSSTSRVQSHSPSPVRSSTTRVQSRSPSPARSSTTRVQSRSPSPARSSTSCVQSRSRSPVRSSFSHVLRHHPSHSRSSTSRVLSRSPSPASRCTLFVPSQSPTPARSPFSNVLRHSPSPARSSTLFVPSRSPSPARSSTLFVPSRSPSPARSSTLFVPSRSPSPASRSTNQDHSEKKDLKSLLEDLRSHVNFLDSAPTCNQVNVLRASVLECAKRAFNRRSFNPNQKLSIVFVDKLGKGEGSVDAGGPTREFFRLLLKEIMNSKFFVGPVNQRSLALDSIGLSQGIYKTLGKMIAVALVHAGMGPCTFSEKLFQQISGQISGVPSISDVDDEELQQMLENIKRASTIREAQAAVLEASPKLSMVGGLAPVKSLRGRDRLVDSIVSYYVYDRMQTAVKQFKEGLETLGVLEKMQSNAETFQNMFACGTEDLSLDEMTSLFSCNYSIEGSNKRAEEELTVCFWRDWLNDVAAGEAFIQPEEDGGEKVTLRLQDILVFATGASQIPPFGFDPVPTISFLHPTVFGGMKKRFPEANTCAIVLHLPIHETYEEFSKWMCSGIIQSPTFGVA